MVSLVMVPWVLVQQLLPPLAMLGYLVHHHMAMVCTVESDQHNIILYNRDVVTILFNLPQSKCLRLESSLYGVILYNHNVVTILFNLPWGKYLRLESSLYCVVVWVM